MREIKFRAWDGVRMQIVQGMKLSTSTFNGVDAVMLDDNYWDGTAKKLRVMQYTGLTDKNGKNIYEGDIVNWSSRKNSEVVWLQETGCWGTGTNPLGAAAKMSEVIGNIYENPELLTSEVSQ